MPPTRRALLRTVTGGTVASAGLLGSDSAAGDATVQQQTAFCPEIRVDDLRAEVTVGDDQPAPDAIAIHLADGAVREYTDGLGSRFSGGYAGWDEAYRLEGEWHGPIVRVEVSRGSRTIAVDHDPELTVTCSLWRGPTATADFTASYRYAYKRYDAPQPGNTYGSPGRRLLSAHGPVPGPDIEFHDRDCEPEGEPAVTFDCASATVEPEEFVNGVPEIHEAILTFADGSEQRYTTGPDQFYEPPQTFAGTGEHEGTVLARLTLYNDPDGRIHFVYDNPELAECLGDGTISITGVSVHPGPHRPGETVDANVTVRNASTDDERFFLGFSALGPDGSVYTNDGQTGHPVTLRESATDFFSVGWDVEPDAPAGSYDAHVAVWAESDRDELSTVLDERIVEDAFEVADASGEVDARVRAATVEDGPHEVGDDVAAEVTVENVGDVAHAFFLGYSAIGPDGVAYTNDGTTGHAVTLEPGESVAETVVWTVEHGAPSGSYDAHLAVWEEHDRDALETTLDDEILEGAFEVA